MFFIGVGLALAAFLGWTLKVAIRRDRHGLGVEPHGPFDPEQSRAESQARIYTGH